MKKTTILMTAIALSLCACQNGKAEKENMPKADVESVVVQEDPTPEPMEVKVLVDTAGYTTTETGLMYKVVKEGNGIKPGINDLVTVNYVGKHMDGREFDSSAKTGKPAKFPVNALIRGWGEGLQLMAPGAVYKFIIPSNLAYGDQGTPGGPIRPNETLYFEVELLNVGE